MKAGGHLFRRTTAVGSTTVLKNRNASSPPSLPSQVVTIYSKPIPFLLPLFFSPFHFFGGLLVAKGQGDEHQRHAAGYARTASRSQGRPETCSAISGELTNQRRRFTSENVGLFICDLVGDNSSSRNLREPSKTFNSNQPIHTAERVTENCRLVLWPGGRQTLWSTSSETPENFRQ